MHNSITAFQSLAYDQPIWIPTALAFFLGCILGSFLNVVGIRVPAGKSVVNPPSSCSHCGHRLGPVDLIPVLGWVIRRGRCRYCGTPISPVYLLGELATGLGFAAVTYFLNDAGERALAYPLVAVLVALTVSDLKYRLLPNKIIFPAMLLYSALRIGIHPLPIWEYVVGFVVGGGVLFAVSYVGMLLGKPAMGGGDMKMMALLGLVVGAKLVWLVLAISSALGCVVGIALIASGKMGRKTFLPFGPFIATGGLLAMLFGNEIVAWYWNQLQMLA